MKLRLPLFLALFHLQCTSASAQKAPGVDTTFLFPERTERIYPISAELARQLVQYEIPLGSLPQLGSPFPVGTDPDTLSPGHYLTANIYGAEVEYTYFDTYTYQARAEGVKGKFELRLLDGNGRLRADAIVSADGKRVKYDKKRQAYVRQDWRIDLLQIVVDQDTLFYRVDEEIDRSRVGYLLRRARYSRPGRLLLYPYALGRRTYQYGRRVIRWGEWRMYNYPFQRYIGPIINPKDAVGYLTTSQPKYRPEDTLKVSAYITAPKGRPLRSDSLGMVIRKEGTYAPVYIKNIPRTEPGRYVYSMPIDPNWPLDKKYTISFDREGFMRRDVGVNISFRLEDYELAEYEMTAEASEETRFPNSAYVDVIAEDINGLTLPDAEIKVILHLKRFTDAVDTAGSISLPDTLYTSMQATEDRREHRLIFPDSLFPTGYSLDVTAEVQLTGPSGEYQSEELEMTIDRRYAHVATFEVVKDSLRIDLRGNGEPPTREGILRKISPRKDTVVEVVTLPYSLKINHHLATYQFVYGDQVVTEDLGKLTPAENNPAVWSRDTFWLSLPNYHNQSIGNARLISEDDVFTSLIARGHVSRYSISGFPPGKTYTLQYQYLAGGIWRTAEFETTSPRYDWETSHPKVLNLEMKQPDEVRPGETIRVAVKATDHKGRPAKNVRLSAGTYNARFEDTPVAMPTFIKKTKRQRRRQDYSLKPIERKSKITPPLWLLEHAGLDTAAVYRLRYPTPEWTLRRSIDTLLPDSAAIAHFAPFVIHKGKPIAIRNIYADDRLVYWYHPNITTPYSIPFDSGWHNIVLRTDKARYTKQLHFNAGEQLVSSFERALHAGAGWKKNAMPKWTDAEIEDLWKRAFVVTDMRTTKEFYYRTGKHQLFQSGRGSTHRTLAPLGLASILDQIEFHFPYGLKTMVPFESRAVYRISSERDRLYPLERNYIEDFLKTEVNNTVSIPRLPRYVLPKRTSEGVGIEPLSSKSLPKLRGDMNRSRIQLIGVPDSIREIALAPSYQNTFYRIDRTKQNTILAGTYLLAFQTLTGRLYVEMVTVAPDQLHLIKFGNDRLSVINDRQDFSQQDTTTEESWTSVTQPIGYFAGAYLTGLVVNSDGNPLIGVSIFAEGSSTGTVTDPDGRFALEVPSGNHLLNVSYTGFKTLQVDPNNLYPPSQQLVLTLEEHSANLDEIVVVGYGSVKRNDVTGSVSTISQEQFINQISATVAGVTISDEGATINIRGSRTNAAEYYVDGVRVEGDPKVMIRGISSIPAGEQKSYVNGVLVDGVLDYSKLGDILELKTENGVVYITTSNPATLLSPTEAEADIRETFADQAAYHPHLATDGKGEAVFDVTFPDDITAWQTYAVGQDRRRRIGFTRKRTKSFLPIQAQLYLPRFLVEGDESEASTIAINRTAEDQAVRLSFSGDNVSTTALDTVLRQSISSSYPIRAEGVTDSLSYQFSLVGAATSSPRTRVSAPETISDGERRSVKVYPKATEMVAGELFMLSDDGLKIPAEYAQAGRGDVRLYLVGNRLEQLLGDLEYITAYPYACSEQTASRLLGLLALRNIRLAEGSTFTRDRDVVKMIKRLEKLRRPDGGFGWWPDSESSTTWITRHVYRALSEAEKNYPVKSLEPVRRYLFTAIPELTPNDRLQTYLALAENGRPPTRDELAAIDTLKTTTDYQFLAITRLHQLAGDTVNTAAVLDSASLHQVNGRYWGRKGRYFWRAPLDNRLNSTLLAQKILRKAGESAGADEAVNYLLGQTAAKNRPGSVPLLGTNTLESARLVDELLPTLLKEGQTLRKPTVSITRGGVTTTVSDFPYETSIPALEAASVVLNRSGSGPLPGAIYQRYFERDATPRDNGYAVTFQIVDGRGRQLTAMSKGVTAYLEVTVTAKKDGEYILIEAPIPAGCSYADRKEAKGRYAVHREYRRDRVAIFCDRLPAGEYAYWIALAPRFKGTYTLNPARVEMQYLPVVNGNGGMEKVVVD